MPAELDGFLFRDAVSDAPFMKGQSKRIWGELFKVLDSSDVIIQVRPAHVTHTHTRPACLQHKSKMHDAMVGGG